MRIESGSTNRYIYFVAVDATDLKTREPSLTGFAVYRSRNGAASSAMTTPTVTETDTTNMPGVYELLLDEDTAIDAANDAEEMVFHITKTGMAPVTRVVELYRPETTAGRTLALESDGVGHADVKEILGNSGSATDLKDFADDGYDPSTNKIQGCVLVDTTTTATTTTTNTDMVSAAPTSAAIADAIWNETASEHVSAGSFGKQVDLILVDTNELQLDWTNGGRLDEIVDNILVDTGTTLNTEVAAIKVQTTSILEDTEVIGAPVGASISVDIADVFTKDLSEGYAGNDTEFTMEQFCYMTWSALSQFKIASTTITSLELDGSDAMTFALDDATTPTERVRAT